MWNVRGVHEKERKKERPREREGGSEGENSLALQMNRLLMVNNALSREMSAPGLAVAAPSPARVLTNEHM